ncbi:hypothetical protein [Micromonospora sp. NPDC050200]|uniref:hypothetical protein n=1 Tax=Micromonospora sp. NPDC050200 TaxID=3155664 RepID=UPI0033E0AF3C
MRITVTLPTVHAPTLVSNALGVAGLLGLAVAIGALAGDWWWSMLVGSVVAIALSWVANTHARAGSAPALASDDAAPRPSRSA